MSLLVWASATSGDIKGCIDWWFTGDWTPGGGFYAAGVSFYLDTQPWLQWRSNSVRVTAVTSDLCSAFASGSAPGA